MKTIQLVVTGLWAASLVCVPNMRAQQVCAAGSHYFGLTIITHGYDFTQGLSGFPGWVAEMGDSINCRMGGNVPIRTLRIIRSGNTDVLLASPVPQIDEMISRGAGILLIDWSDADGGVCGKAVRTTKIAGRILEYLGQRQELLKLPIHLIGHSRGGSVMSCVASNLGANGVWVGGPWQSASGTTNWTRQATVGSGINTIQARCLDPSGNQSSPFAAVTVAYITYNISASAGSGGTISPNGNFTKSAGENQVFTVCPTPNYFVDQWLLDGIVTQTGGTTYTLVNIQTNHGLQVTFTYVPAQPGTMQWSVYGGQQFTASPAIGADGTIYIGTTGSLRDPQRFYAIRPCGTTNWYFEAPDDFGGFTWSSFGSPAIGPDGTIYVATSYKGLYALRPNGAVRWNLAIGGENTQPAIGADGTIYVCAGSVYAISPVGTNKWTYSNGWSFSLPPAVGADGVVYVANDVGNGSRLTALGPQGNCLWSYFTTYTFAKSSPAIGPDGTIYIGNDSYGLHAINPTGTEKWIFNIGPFGDPVCTSPVVGPDGVVYVVANTFFDDGLWAINPNGTTKWSAHLGGFSSPAIGRDGSAYVTAGNVLHEFKPNGSNGWQFVTGGSGNFGSSSPTIGSDGTIYVGSLNDFFYAVNNTNLLASSSWPKYGRDVKNSSRALQITVAMSQGRDLLISAEIGLNYRVETSSNLQTWTAITNLVSTNSIMRFRDPSATNYSHRFYRALTP